MSKLVIFGCGSLSKPFIDVLHASTHQLELVVSPSDDIAPIGEFNLSRYCQSLGIQSYCCQDINETNLAKRLDEINPDLIISTWHKIIDPSILSLSKSGVLGTHPTPLPYYRGRHPLHWLIARGATTSALTYFIMDASIDSGSIISQHPFNIAGADVKSAQCTVNSVGKLTILQAVESVLSGYRGYPQNSSISTYFRARTRHDTILDPRMNIALVDRLVRSFNKPFDCAEILLPCGSLHITKTEDVTACYPLSYDCHYGKIYATTNNTIDVGFFDGVLRLSVDTGSVQNLRSLKIKFIHPPTYYIHN